MKRLSKLVIILNMLSTIFVSPLVFAASPNDAVNCSGASASAFCSGQTTSNKLYGTDGIITKAAKIITIITGVASLFILTLAGMRFIRSSGDPGKIEEARNTIIYAVIGIVVTISGQAIISLVLNKL